MQCFVYLMKIMMIDLSYASLSERICSYIDPGTGSFIFQILLAGFLGGLVAIRLFWNSIKIFFKKRFSKGEEDLKNDE